VSVERGTGEALSRLSWRLVGPHRGGRVTAVAGHPTDPNVFYFGHCAGGVWKTADGGRFWENISDGYFNTGAVGALAVAPSDPNVIYAGMGETTIRGDVSHGDGVYRSTDGGKTWQHRGLATTRHVAKVRVHPANPDHVYVAALGHAFGPNPDRGIFRSTDGGGTWEKILYRGERAGGIDLAMDPSNPRILYASLWEAQRSPYSLSSGGPGSGLFKSTDGGDSWVELDAARGLPGGIWGKVGVAVSPANPDRVWALVEAKQGGVFRSDDAGASWRRISEERDPIQRAWYFMHVFADPQDPETVWSLNVRAFKSTDGGRHFSAVPTPFEDQHDLWIDPQNPLRMIEGNDGGACVSFNGGRSWSSQYNQPTAQFYHVTTDNQVPYRLYGAQQDINTLSVPSRSDNAAITAADWYSVGGGESGTIAVRPDDPNVVYAGSFGGHLTRYDHRTRQVQDIGVWPDDPMGWGAGDLKYRFQWTFPVAVSVHDPNVLYVTSQHVHRSRDEGMSWETISPDLTRNDPATLGMSGGPITKDNVSTEYYGTVFAFAESPVEANVLWAGSDDGLIHVSQDGGATWRNVTPSSDVLPEWALVSIIEPSSHDAATAYVAATRYKQDDYAPYLLRTADYGQTWTRIVDGIPAEDFTRVIRADPGRRGLLYAGTETGVYVSFDDGGHWERFRGNLPVTPIHDLAVKDGDLIAATHGRSFWILDDVTPLRDPVNLASDGAHLFAPRPTTRFRSFHGFSVPPAEGKNSRLIGPVHVAYRREERAPGETRDVLLDAGENPPSGVVVTYSLPETAGRVELSFHDAEGQVIQTFASADGATEPGQPALPAGPGLHRFVWDTRYPHATLVHGATFWEGGVEGPPAVPGTYEARLTVAGKVQRERFEIRADPRVPATADDLARQFELLLQIRDTLSATHAAVNEIGNLRGQLGTWRGRATGRADLRAEVAAADELDGALTAIEQELMERSRDLPYHAPIRLNAKLAALTVVVGGADAAPTRQSFEVYRELAGQVEAQLSRLREVEATQLGAFNRRLRELDLPLIDTGQASGS